MNHFILELLANWHIYLGIIIFLILTGAGLPIPEEVPIVMAGVLSSGPEPELDPWIAFISCMIGALMGDSLVYFIGRYLGRPFLIKYAFFAKLVHVEREKQMEEMLRRHGLKVFFVARFMVGIRAPLYLAAGMMRVPWRLFILVDGICALVVVGLVFSLSMIYGEEISRLFHEYQIALTVLVGLGIAVAVGIYFLRRKRQRRLQAESALQADETPGPHPAPHDAPKTIGSEVAAAEDSDAAAGDRSRNR